MNRVLLFLLLAAGVSPAAAAVAGVSLEMSRDVRGAALGPGFVASAEGASAVHENPAGLTRLARPQVSAMHALHALDTRVTSMHAAHPHTALGAIGLSLFSVASGGFEGRGRDGERTGGFSAEDRSVGLAAARSFSEGTFSAGAGVNYFESRLGGARAAAFTADLVL